MTKWSHSRAHPHSLHGSFFTISVDFKHKITPDLVYLLPAGIQWPFVTHSGTLESSAAQR